MSNCKVCVSVGARTAFEAFEMIRRADETADLIEVRFDHLEPGEITPLIRAVENNKPRKPLIATFRPREQGGNKELTLEERLGFWQEIDTSIWGVDLEEELAGEFENDGLSIVSFHDFSGGQLDLEPIFGRLTKCGKQVVKIAVQTDDVVDSIPLWKLLERATKAGVSLTPIGMGEAGKFTRILGTARGAFMTYASPDGINETAPGQISATDLIETYRIRQLDMDTEVFGVIAGDTSYSISPWMQNAAFRTSKLNKVFVPLQTSDVGEFISRIVSTSTREFDLNFGGFSVTNPHKQAILKHLDHIDAAAEKMGAVNTVKIEDGKLCGYNTDADGFIAPLQKRFGDLTGANVAVIGAGGAARACIFALKINGANVTILARDQARREALANEFGVSARTITGDLGGFDIIVNATPVGTVGAKENETPVTSRQLGDVKLVYDLVYNPAETRLIREAKAGGVDTIAGIEMLIAQGAKQFEIWTGESAPIDEMTEAVRKQLNL